MPFRLMEIVVDGVGVVVLPAVLPTAMANDAVAAWDTLKGNERLTVLLSAYRGVGCIEQPIKDAVIEKVGLRTWESLVRIFAIDGNNLYWNLLSNDKLFDEYGYRVFSFVEESGDFLARPIPTVLDPTPEEVFPLHVNNVFAGDADRIDLVPREVVYLHAPKNAPSDTEVVTLYSTNLDSIVANVIAPTADYGVPAARILDGEESLFNWYQTQRKVTLRPVLSKEVPLGWVVSPSPSTQGVLMDWDLVSTPHPYHKEPSSRAVTFELYYTGEDMTGGYSVPLAGFYPSTHPAVVVVTEWNDLPSETQVALMERVIKGTQEGLSFADIAESGGCDVKTVEVLVGLFTYNLLILMDKVFAPLYDKATEASPLRRKTRQALARYVDECRGTPASLVGWTGPLQWRKGYTVGGEDETFTLSDWKIAVRHHEDLTLGVTLC